MAKSAAVRSILRLSYVLAAVAALAIGVLATLYERQNRVVHRQEQRSDANDALSMLRTQLQGSLDGAIQMVEGLVGIVEYAPDITPEDFTRLAERVTRGREGIRALAAAPDLVVSMVYPPVAAPLLGRDLLADPRARRAASMARALGATVVSGPVDLVGGNGRAFIIRAPVFVDGAGQARQFWGLVDLALDQDMLMRDGGLVASDLPIDVALVARDDISAEPTVISGDPSVLDRDPLRAEVVLPVGHWTLAAVPKGGWTTPDPWPQRLVFAMAALLVAVPILGAGRLIASRQARIAEIREREVELARLSWRLEFALAASNVGVWDVDIATDQLLWDERACRLFGFPERQGYLSEADWIGAVHPDDRAGALAAAREAASGNGKFVSLYRIVRPDGEIRHIRDVAGHYVDAEDVPRMVGLMWDVTADVERQEELDLRRREAEAATDAKSRFLATMSHEIRTPMTGVLGLLGLMIEEPLSERQRERATIALASARNLLDILNDILDFSKLEASQIRLVNERVPVRRLVGEVMELMAPNAEAKGLALTLAVADAVPDQVETDPARLRQILTNLVSNATKFTDEGEVAVRVGFDSAEGRGTLSIEVEDTGIGIAPEQQDRVFERFVQADTSLARRAGGTGLGLAICRQLAERMGGGLALRSVPGMGSTFVLTVPAPAVGGVGIEPPSAPEPDAPPGPAPMRVLLAEDNPTNQYLLNAYLRSAGHTVELVANGVQAVAAAARGGFDVILMDVQMPELDGLAASRRIRALPGAAGLVPIVALTANALARDRDACLEAGMTDYLPKPIDVSALHRALARARADAPAAVERRSAGAH